MKMVSLEQLDSDIEALRRLSKAGNAPHVDLKYLLELRQKLEGATASDWEACRLLIEHLPENRDDILGTVIKGHLLFDSIIRRFVDTRTPNGPALDAARFTSYQMICLAEALCLRNEEPRWLWARIKELNSLRNTLAHNLEPAEVQERIARFVTEVDNKDKLAGRTLVGAISRLYGMLRALADLARAPESRD